MISFDEAVEIGRQVVYNLHHYHKSRDRKHDAVKALTAIGHPVFSSEEDYVAYIEERNACKNEVDEASEQWIATEQRFVSLSREAFDAGWQLGHTFEFEVSGTDCSVALVNADSNIRLRWDIRVGDNEYSMTGDILVSRQ